MGKIIAVMLYVSAAVAVVGCGERSEADASRPADHSSDANAKRVVSGKLEESRVKFRSTPKD